MNPGIPFINPFRPLDNNQNNDEKLINKIERLEKSIRIIENRLNKLENNNIKPSITNEPTDMYMI